MVTLDEEGVVFAVASLEDFLLIFEQPFGAAEGGKRSRKKKLREKECKHTNVTRSSSWKPIIAMKEEIA
jgi:hypothetical protein